MNVFTNLRFQNFLSPNASSFSQLPSPSNLNFHTFQMEETHLLRGNVCLFDCE